MQPEAASFMVLKGSASSRSGSAYRCLARFEVAAYRPWRHLRQERTVHAKRLMIT